MSIFIYEKDRQRAISFPVGGIGTGCIGIGGNGCLIDWQIYNRPAMGTRNGFSHFALKATDPEGKSDTRVLISDLTKPYLGQVDERTMLGFPHFKELTFEGRYPEAVLHFRDETFPGKARMHYYNPLIPLNDRDSGIPALFAQLWVENTTDREMVYTAAGVLTHPGKGSCCVNRFRQEEGMTGIHFITEEMDETDVDFCDFTLATDGEYTVGQEAWYRGGWKDPVETYWREFACGDELPPRHYDEAAANYKDTGMLAATARLAPGQKHLFRFVLTWNVPNCNNYWSGLDISTSNIP